MNNVYIVVAYGGEYGDDDKATFFRKMMKLELEKFVSE